MELLEKQYIRIVSMQLNEENSRIIFGNFKYHCDIGSIYITTCIMPKCQILPTQMLTNGTVSLFDGRGKIHLDIELEPSKNVSVEG